MSLIDFCNDRILNGFTNVLVYGNEVQPGCKIIANGSSDSDAVITIDFGQGPCGSSSRASLKSGSISINGNEIVFFDASYTNIIFLMSNCDDEVSIIETYPDSSSVEVIGYSGNDKVVIGNANMVVADVFGNIIFDGGVGSDVLFVHDQGHSQSKSVAIHSTVIAGIHGSDEDNIYYYEVETVDISLGTADMNVDVFSTAKDVHLILTTQGKLFETGRVYVHWKAQSSDCFDASQGIVALSIKQA